MDNVKFSMLAETVLSNIKYYGYLTKSYLGYNIIYNDFNTAYGNWYGLLQTSCVYNERMEQVDILMRTSMVTATLNPSYIVLI